MPLITPWIGLIFVVKSCALGRGNNWCLVGYASCGGMLSLGTFLPRYRQPSKILEVARFSPCNIGC